MPNLDFRGLFEDEPMTNPTPIQPPTTQPPAVPEGLLAQWRNQAILSGLDLVDRQDWMARAAAAWAGAQRGEEVREAEQRGADAEYSACHTWLDINGCPSRFIDGLREARRPSPPTLREQALKALRERLDNPMVVHLPENRAAMELALQALKETPND